MEIFRVLAFNLIKAYLKDYCGANEKQTASAVCFSFA